MDIHGPCKPEVKPGAREESASSAWLAASANSKFIYSSTIPSIHGAVSKMNIFGKGYSLGSIISYPASYHDEISPSKANLVQDHGYFFTVIFKKRFSPFFTLRVKTSPN